MTEARATIGDRELDLLRWIEEQKGATVGEAAERFGTPLGLARSTVLTMMERLRRKGHLRRKPVGGVFRYTIAIAPRELVRRAVAQFVEATLGGSLSPFVAYLAEKEELDEAQVEELEQLVAKLREKRSGEPR
jgi:predicted transcriptional regulator